MSPLGLVVLAIFVLVLLGGLGGGSFISAWPYGYGYHHGGIGVIGVLIIILLWLAFTGRI